MTASRTNTLRWVVMGVSGCGKSFIGSLLASQLGVDYVEGDALHPPENVAKMAAGVPLTDAARAQGVGLVVSCSALKRAYRELLREGDPALRFAHLDGPRAVLLQRMQDRQHFMPASLLDSQLQTLQPLQEDEAGIVLDFRDPPEMLVEQLLQAA
jgi:gluconokinase